MHRIQRVLSLFVASAIVAGCAGAPVVDCSSSGRTPVELKFKVKTDGCVDAVKMKDGTDGTRVYVCHGDTVEWIVKVQDQGNGDKEKAVDFNKSGDSPFDWNHSGNQTDKIIGTVRRDAKDMKYEYSVRTKLEPGRECSLDPMLIVRY